MTETVLNTTSGLAKSFLDQNVDSIKSTLKIDVDKQRSRFSEDRLSEAIENEIGFCTAVITAYERWNKEGGAVVLWDIDDTIGKNEFGTGNTPHFRFRTSFLPLANFLKEHFPNIKNGILSNRSIVTDQLKESTQLLQISNFVDHDHIYSSRITIISQEQDELDKEIFEKTGSHSLNNDHLQKFKVIKDLQVKGLNIKIIDDNKIAESMKENGVYTYRYFPQYFV